MIRRPVWLRINIENVQAGRKVLLAVLAGVGLVLFALTASSSAKDSFAHQAIEWAGLVLIFICILGRTWSSFYIGGRKIVELVTKGPYSIMRNPLYVFSAIGAAGIGAQLGSVILALIFACVVFWVFSIVAQHEERLLLRRYRQSYVAYLRRVPRFVPDLSLWQDEPTLTIRQSRVFVTFGDALLFLLAVPLARLCEYLQSTGVLPVLALLP